MTKYLVRYSKCGDYETLEYYVDTIKKAKAQIKEYMEHHKVPADDQYWEISKVLDHRYCHEKPKRC